MEAKDNKGDGERKKGRRTDAKDDGVAAETNAVATWRVRA
jgi:hypothetical protein